MSAKVVCLRKIVSIHLKGNQYTFNSVNIILLPSEKGSTLKGKNLHLLGANSFLSV